MNYIKIRTAALLLLASTSHLNVTTATIPSTTDGKVSRIFINFVLIDEFYKSMNRAEANQQNIMREKINTSKNKIIKLIKLDETIVDQTNSNSFNGFNETIVMRAAELGFTYIINTLLERGANIEATDDYEYTALMWAAQNIQYDTTKLLLYHGADAIIKNNKKGNRTALKIAGEVKRDIRQRDKVVELLRSAEKAQRNANKIHSYFNLINQTRTNLIDEKLKQQLVNQIQNYKKGIVDILTNDEKILNQRESAGYYGTILMRASGHGYKDIVTILLRRKADIDAKDGDGHTALMEASKHHYFDIVKLLLEADADVTLTNNSEDTALDLAKEDHIGETHTMKQVDTTALLTAAEEAQKKANDIHSHLISINELCSTRLNQKDNAEKQKLTTLIRKHENKIAEILKSDENIINQRSPKGYKEPLLVRAAALGNRNTINILLERNANVNATDIYGYTALMMAAKFLRFDIVELLLGSEANALITNTKGETALDLVNEDNDDEELEEAKVRAKIKIIRLLGEDNPQAKAKHTAIPLRPSIHLEHKDEYKDDTLSPLPGTTTKDEPNSSKHSNHESGRDDSKEPRTPAVTQDDTRPKSPTSTNANINTHTHTTLKPQIKYNTSDTTKDEDESSSSGHSSSVSLTGFQNDTSSKTSTNIETKSQDQDSKNDFATTTTFKQQPRPFIISPGIIEQIKAKQKICNITFIIFFVFVLISTPSYFYIRLKT